MLTSWVRGVDWVRACVVENSGVDPPPSERENSNPWALGLGPCCPRPLPTPRALSGLATRGRGTALLLDLSPQAGLRLIAVALRLPIAAAKVLSSTGGRTGAVILAGDHSSGDRASTAAIDA